MAKDNESAPAASVRPPRQQRPAGPPGGMTPAVIIKRTAAHWQLLVGAMIVGGLATAQAVRVHKAAYKSETVIFYREGIQRSFINNDPGGPDPLRTLGAKLKEMLLAQSNLKKVREEYRLYEAIVAKQDENAAVEQFRKKIDFKARSTDTFVISFEGTSRDEAQQVTARLAELLVGENAKLKQEQAKTTTEFLDAEKKRSNDDLEKSETELAKFVAEHPEFASDNTQGTHVGTSVRAPQNTPGSPEVVRRRAPLPGAAAAATVDPALAAARTAAAAEVAAANKDLTDKAARYTDEHPDVRAAKLRASAAAAALKAVDDQIMLATPPPAPPVSAPRPAYERRPIASASASASAKAKDPPPRSKDDAIVAMETDWARLNRDVAKARQRAADLETRLFKAEMAASSELGGYAAQVAVLDPAYRPTGPSSMPNKTVIAAGFIASLMLGVALAALRGLFFDDRIFDVSEIDALAVGPTLGVVPTSAKPKKKAARG